MNIIVEGIDKAGKSTMIRDLQSLLRGHNPVTFKISQKPPNNDPTERFSLKVRYNELFIQTNDRQNQNKIFLWDRSYPSELVYSIKRGYDAFEDQEILALDETLAQIPRTILIYCYASPHVLASRFVKDNEEFAKVNEIGILLDRYNKFLEMTNLRHIKVSSENDRHSNLLQVNKFIHEHI